MDKEKDGKDNHPPLQPLKFWAWESKRLLIERDKNYLGVVEGNLSEFDKVGRWSWYKYELGMELLREKYKRMKKQEKKMKNIK